MPAGAFLSFDFEELGTRARCAFENCNRIKMNNPNILDSDYKFICDNYMIQYIYIYVYYSYSMVDIRAVAMPE